MTTTRSPPQHEHIRQAAVGRREYRHGPVGIDSPQPASLILLTCSQQIQVDNSLRKFSFVPAGRRAERQRFLSTGRICYCHWCIDLNQFTVFAILPLYCPQALGLIVCVCTLPCAPC